MALDRATSVRSPLERTLRFRAPRELGLLPQPRPASRTVRRAGSHPGCSSHQRLEPLRRQLSDEANYEERRADPCIASTRPEHRQQRRPRENLRRTRNVGTTPHTNSVARQGELIVANPEQALDDPHRSEDVDYQTDRRERLMRNQPPPPFVSALQS